MTIVITVGLAVAITLQMFVSFRALDGWRLALRREAALCELLNGIASEDEARTVAGHRGVVEELAAQERYERTRWWFHRAPRLGEPWPARFQVTTPAGE